MILSSLAPFEERHDPKKLMFLLVLDIFLDDIYFLI